MLAGHGEEEKLSDVDIFGAVLKDFAVLALPVEFRNLCTVDCLLAGDTSTAARLFELDKSFGAVERELVAELAHGAVDRIALRARSRHENTWERQHVAQIGQAQLL